MEIDPHRAELLLQDTRNLLHHPHLRSTRFGGRPSRDERELAARQTARVVKSSPGLESPVEEGREGEAVRSGTAPSLPVVFP